jgi:phage shock protein A
VFPRTTLNLSYLLLHPPILHLSPLSLSLCQERDAAEERVTELDAAVEDIQERAASIESVKSFLTDKLKHTEATVAQLEDEKNQLKAQKNSDQEVRNGRTHVCNGTPMLNPPLNSSIHQV